MADNLTTQSNTPATIPADTKIATDDAGAAGHVQVVKLAVSTDGSATPLTADNTDGLLVNLGSNNDVVISDGGNTITVDGTVSVTGVATAANQSTANTALAAIQTAVEKLDDTVSGSELQVDVVTLPALPSGTNNIGDVDIATMPGTAVEDAASSSGATGVLTLGVRNDSATSKTSDDGDYGALAIDAAGRVGVTDLGGSITVDNNGTFATQAAQSGTWNITNVSGTVSLPTGAATSAKQDTVISHLDGVEGLLTTIDADTGTLAGAVAGTEMQVDVITLPSIPAGTNNIGDVDVLSLPAIPAGNNNIGDVDIASIAAGDNNIGNVDIASIAAGDNNIGNVDLASAIPAGTNAIGKLLPPDIDVTAHTNYAKKYYTNSGAVTDGIIWSPAAGKRWHVVSMYINVSAAATVILEDDKSGGDEVIWKGEYAANSGVTIHFGEMYPLASGEDAADLIITTSAGNVYVTVTGFEI